MWKYLKTFKELQPGFAKTNGNVTLQEQEARLLETLLDGRLRDSVCPCLQGRRQITELSEKNFKVSQHFCIICTLI